MSRRTLHFISPWLGGLALAALGLGLAVPAAAQATRVSLAGPWGFRMDPEDQGQVRGWFRDTLPDRIRLPGSLTENDRGEELSVNTKWTGGIVDRSWFNEDRFAPYRQPGAIKVPFWLTPTKYYVGPAWYRREVEAPADWQGRRVVLWLERCHWETRLWVDNTELGQRDSLSTPHVYDLTGALPPGKHRLTLRVDNRLKIAVGENAHSVSDHTQGNWNGVVGRLELRAGPLVWLDDIQVFPDVARKSARVKVRVANAAAGKGRGVLTLSARSHNTRTPHHAAPQSLPVDITSEGAVIETDYPLGPAAQTWDEFSPALYRLEAKLESHLGGTKQTDAQTVTFGLRELEAAGSQFTLNGRPILLRGTLECCIFPLTGYPPTDKEAWRRVIRACQAHGLNFIRFHSHCPPEAAFAAADELGFYYHVECAAWADVDDARLGEFIRAESDRILRAYGNHPSFCLLAYGNEPGGKNQNRFLGDLVNSWKAKDPRRKYTSAAGWPIIPENDYHMTPTPRIQAWGAALSSRINAKPPETVTDYSEFISKYKVPVVSHEIGQWCVYPNLKEAAKYRGVLKAKNFDIFRDSLAASHQLAQAEQFLFASGKLQALCYKEEIESALRTPGMGGFALLDLHDFPGQGTALVGVLDPFWESKGYITPGEYRRFCGPTVPLALLGKRVFTAGETLTARVRVAHFGPTPLPRAKPVWSLRVAGGPALARGALPPQRVPIGNDTTLGEISVPLPGTSCAQKLVLTVALEGTSAANDWDLWVYPATVSTAPPQGVLVREEFDADAISALNAGGKVLLLLPPKRVRGDRRGRVALGFSSIFWNTAWTGRQPPHTLGVLCDPRHPALAAFPTDYHSNWQWWYLLSRSQAMILDDLPPQLRPVVQVVDDWFTNRRLGLAFEARFGLGRLLVSSMDLRGDLDTNPVARQMLHSLLAYLDSPRFHPAVELTADQLRGLLAPTRALDRLGARVTGTDSAEPGQGGENAIDGDPATMWHTAWSDAQPAPPHHLELVFAQPCMLRGVTLLPRQDGNKNGWIKDYACYVSDDGAQWGEPVAQGALADDARLKTVLFTRPVRGRHLRWVALSEVNGSPWTSLAELDVIPADNAP